MLITNWGRLHMEEILVPIWVDPLVPNGAMSRREGKGSSTFDGFSGSVDIVLLGQKVRGFIDQ
jgi:hypothetical protein